MNKGISPLIAAVFLIAFVIAIAGIAYFWGIPLTEKQKDNVRVNNSEGLENKTAEQIEQQAREITKTVQIVTISCNNDMVYVRNTGTQTIGSGDLLVINMDTSEQNTNANSMDPHRLLGITLPSDGITDGDSIVVHAPGNTDSQTASC